MAGGITVFGLCFWRLRSARSLEGAVPRIRLIDRTGWTFPVSTLGLLATGAYLTSSALTPGTRAAAAAMAPAEFGSLLAAAAAAAGATAGAFSAIAATAAKVTSELIDTTAWATAAATAAFPLAGASATS